MGMVVWALWLQEQTQQPIYSNIPKMAGNARYFEKWRDLKKVENAIVLFDEIDTTADSRNFKSYDQIFFTHLFKQMGKKGLTFMYTSQRSHMVEKRIRDQTDYVIKTSKNWLTGKIKYDWFDCQTNEFGTHVKTYLLTKPSVFYEMYDSFAIVESQMIKE